jgi:hypothetical protein
MVTTVKDDTFGNMSSAIAQQMREGGVEAGIPDRPVRLWNIGYELGTKVYHDHHVYVMPEKGEYIMVGALRAKQLVGKSQQRLSLMQPIIKERKVEPQRPVVYRDVVVDGSKNVADEVDMTNTPETEAKSDMSETEAKAEEKPAPRRKSRARTKS